MSPSHAQNMRLFGNESRTSFLLASLNPYTSKPVELDELADSESSRDDISDIRLEQETDSINLIIQDYKEHRPTFRFSEIFHDDLSRSAPQNQKDTAISSQGGAPDLAPTEGSSRPPESKKSSDPDSKAGSVGAPFTKASTSHKTKSISNSQTPKIALNTASKTTSKIIPQIAKVNPNVTIPYIATPNLAMRLKRGEVAKASGSGHPIQATNFPLTGPFERPEPPATPNSQTSHHSTPLGLPSSYCVSLSSGELLSQLGPSDPRQLDVSSETALNTPTAFSQPDKHAAPRTKISESNFSQADTLRTNNLQVDNFQANPKVNTPQANAVQSRSPRNLLQAGTLSYRSPKSEYIGYNTDGLTAGIDSTLELPITLYTVQDPTSPTSRWSVYEDQRNKAVTSPSAVNAPKPVYLTMKDGSNSARRVSTLTNSTWKSAHTALPYPPLGSNLPKGSNTPQLPEFAGRSYPLHLDKSRQPSSNYSATGRPGATSNGGSRNTSSSASAETRNDRASSGGLRNSSGSRNSVGGRWFEGGPRMLVAQNQTLPLQPHHLGSNSDILSLPSSMVRESKEKQDLSHDMFGDGGDLIFANVRGSPVLDFDFETGLQTHGPMPYTGTFYLWSRWGLVMCTGLLAVPVFFLLALGVFDHGGFASLSLAEKNSLLRRYNRRYSPAQKTASVLIGLLWVVIVFLMIAVAFAVGLRRSPI